MTLPGKIQTTESTQFLETEGTRSPRISIIMATYNQQHLIDKSIQKRTNKGVAKTIKK